MKKKRLHDFLSVCITVCLVVSYVLLLMCVWLDGVGVSAITCAIAFVVFLSVAVLLVFIALLVEIFIKE